MMDISVITCTYNPDLPTLEKCLDAIAKAYLRYPIKEIILIDNNSTEPISELALVKKFLQNQPTARVVSEPVQGLTHARLSGIAQASGELLIFIDDDNIIRDDFFLEADRISKEYPFIGAFSGQVQLQYAVEPPDWTRRYWGMLVHRLFKGNSWGNLYFENNIMPNGAGLCVNRKVALYYKSLHESGQRNITLDRSGQSLMSGGDNDLAMCACDLGLGMGLFEKLFLYHFLPTSRFTLSYLTRLTHGIYYSDILLKYMRKSPTEKTSIKRKIFDQIRTYSMAKEDRAIVKAMYAGQEEAYIYLESKKSVVHA